MHSTRLIMSFFLVMLAKRLKQIDILGLDRTDQYNEPPYIVTLGLPASEIEPAIYRTEPKVRSMQSHTKDQHATPRGRVIGHLQ